MNKKKIISVGFELPARPEIEFVSINSRYSLLDADIILFSPTLQYRRDYLNGIYKGKPSLDDESSAETRESIRHWSKQISDAFVAGKTIIVHLCPREVVYADTGETRYEGKGRNSQKIRIVGEISNYHALPVDWANIFDAEGSAMKLTKEAAIIRPYWNVVKPFSRYHLYYNTKHTPVVVTSSGDKTVGSVLIGEKGAFVALPSLELPKEFTHQREGKTYWTETAVQFGKQVVTAVVELDHALKQREKVTPMPEWAKGAALELPSEAIVQGQIDAVSHQIVALRARQQELAVEKAKAALPKNLLFETGAPLENAVLDALQTFGFEAKHYKDADSEFDVVFSSEEGRFIGEVEGKDSSAINIQKLQQLERNIQEDFAKEHTNEYARGVLFGNAHRLIKPADRKEDFTPKVLSAAQRSGIALVRTSDLFPAVRYLKANTDCEFAKQVRSAIAQTKGTVVKIPDVPASNSAATGSIVQAEDSSQTTSPTTA